MIKEFNYLQLTILATTFAWTMGFLGCASAPKWIKGQWQGIGYQVDGHSWEVSLDATDLSKIQIDYPDLDCGGNWKIVKKTKNGANLRELLTYGLEKCDQNVEVLIERPSNGEMKITYFLKSYSPEAIATAVLSRK